jgi:hypothetical protein
MDHESEDLIDFVLITEMGFFVLLLRLGLQLAIGALKCLASPN